MSFTDHLQTKKKASQGKSAESKVADYLADMDAKHLHFDWHRGYDARSAGGKFQRVAGDYSFYRLEDYGIFEVKEVDHANRLPYKNYEFSKVAKAVKRELAGGRVLVVIYFSKIDAWRWKPISFFQKRDQNVGSWDFSNDYDIFPKVDQILNSFFSGQIIPKP